GVLLPWAHGGGRRTGEIALGVGFDDADAAGHRGVGAREFYVGGPGERVEIVRGASLDNEVDGVAFLDVHAADVRGDVHPLACDGLRPKIARYSRTMRLADSLSVATSLRAINWRVARSMKGLFSMNSACCGTVVKKRHGLCVSGLAKSNVRNTPGRFWRSMNP